MGAGLGFIVSVIIVAAAMVALATGLSGLMVPDPAGGLGRTIGGLLGFFLIVVLMLVWATSQRTQH